MLALEDTIEMMKSSDYNERFKAEYWQLKIRYDRLFHMVEALINNRLPFQPTCSKEILEKQLEAMYSYLTILAERAKIENVDLSE